MKKLEKAFKGQMVRVEIDKKGREWFAVTDVGKILEISDVQRRAKRLPSKGVILSQTLTNGGMQELMYVDEPNLYRLVFTSKKKEALEFQDWIFEEVIPSIRKTGKYSIPENLKTLSVQNRKVLTDTWRDCGIEKKHHFIQLTLQEYKALGIDKKKKDMDKAEILLLSAMESMEALKLFHTPKDNYYDCRDSLFETAKVLPCDEVKEIK